MHVDVCQSVNGTDPNSSRHRQQYQYNPIQPQVATSQPPPPNHHGTHSHNSGGPSGNSAANLQPHQPLIALHQNFTNQLLSPFHHHPHLPHHHHHHHHHHHPHPHPHPHPHHHHHRRALGGTDQSNSSTSSSTTQVNPNKQHKSRHHQPVFQPDTLLDLSARIVALNIPFQIIEEKYERIPEPVQRKIIFWSFPRNEDDIKMYSSLSSESSTSNLIGSTNTTTNNSNNSNTNNNNNSNNNNNANSPVIYNNNEASPNNNSNINSNVGNNGNSNPTNRQTNQQRLPFYKGLKLCENGSVFDVLQVGFHLSGLINLKTYGSSNRPGTSRSNFTSLTSGSGNSTQTSNSNTGSESQNDLFVKSYRVSVTFDRCKIISVSCTCDSRDIFWCEHVVALIIYRIRNPKSIDLRVPISETLLQLDRQQLQKLVQYIIAEHHAEVIPTAQRLADEISQSVSTINKIQGAPDPTAGAGADDEHIWHLDENQVSERVRSYLNSINSNSKDTVKHVNDIIALFDKVKEMLRAKDSNGPRMLRLITEQFLSGSTRNDKCRPLWDQLVSLWVVVILNPHSDKSERKKFKSLLTDWSHLPKCPQEDVEFRSTSNYSTGIKRKASDLSDDEDGEESAFVNCPYYAAYNHNNSFPAHMGSHNHRSYSNPGSYLMRSYQNNIIPPSFPHYLSPHLLQMASNCGDNSLCGYPSFSKSRDCHHHTHQDPTYTSYAKSRLQQYHFSCNRPGRLSSYNPSCRSSSGPRSDANPYFSIHSQPRSMHPGNSANPAVEPHSGPKSIFQRAIDVSDLSWSDPHLRLILENDEPLELDTSKMHLFDCKGYPLWLETVPVACARVEALKSHGYKKQSLRLAVSIVRTLKRHQEHWEVCGANCNSLPGEPIVCNLEGWIGHPFDPIGSLFETLLEASRTSNKEPSEPCCEAARCACMFGLNIPHPFASLQGALMFPDLSSTFDHYPHTFDLPNFSASATTQSSSSSGRRLLNPPSSTHKNSHYHHVPVPGCRYQKDSYLTLAIDAVLIALGQHRAMPSNGGAHEKAIRQEKSLISRLQVIEVESDPVLIEVLKRQVCFILNGGPFASSCCSPITEPAPFHKYALYLFNTLIGKDPVLAYDIGIYALKIPIPAEDNNNEVFVNGNMNNGQMPHAQRSINYAHIQSEQLALAESMLKTAKDDRPNNCLKYVYDAAIENIRIPANLFKLAKAASGAAVQCTPGSKYPSLQKTSFKLGQHVLKMTMAPTAANAKTRRDVIQSIVKWAVALGFEDIINFLDSWPEYLTAHEAVTMVSKEPFTSQTQMQLNREQRVRLDSKIRDLSVKCVERDPSQCALDALKLCEHDKSKFQQAYNLVIEAGKNREMGSDKLIAVASHLDKKQQTPEAYEIALVAIESMVIPSNIDSSASFSEIDTTCELARSMNGFDKLIPILINNVHCAPVLSEIYKKYRPDPMNDLSILYNGDGHHQPADYRRRCLSTKYHCDQKLWESLLQAAIFAYGQTTQTRLENISPRHYAEFIEFLEKAQHTFLFAHDGHGKFMSLIQGIKKNYKTKKKLMERLNNQFKI